MRNKFTLKYTEYIYKYNSLKGGRSQGADHPSTMCFLHSVYMQRVVLVRNARIVLVIRKMAPSYDNLFMGKFE